MKLLKRSLGRLLGTSKKEKNFELYDESTFCRALGRKYDELDTLKGLAERTLNNVDTLDATPINFRGIAFGSSVDFAKKQLGSPSYIYVSKKMPKYVVLFYKSKIGDSTPFWSELHFHDNTLILGKNLIENYEEERLQWTNLLRRKYGISQIKHTQVIKDSSEHYIAFNSSIFFEISYMDLHYLHQFTSALHEIRQDRKIKRAAAKASLLDYA